MAASTCVESVRCRPRAVRKRHARHRSSSPSSKRPSARPASKRARNSHRTEASKPVSLSSRLSTYFQSMRLRTAAAAWRSESPWRELQERHQRQTPGRFSRSAPRGEQRGKGRVLIQAAECVLHPQIHLVLGQRGVSHPGRLGGNCARIVGILRVERHGGLLAQQAHDVNDRDPPGGPRVPPSQHCLCRPHQLRRRAPASLAFASNIKSA